MTLPAQKHNDDFWIKPLKLAIETLDEGVAVVDANGVIIFANAHAQRLLGMPQDELQKRSYRSPEWRLYTTDGTLLSREAHPISLALQRGESVHDAEFSIERPDGTRRIVYMHTVPFLDSSGAVAGAVATFCDVTERRQAERALKESERRFREMLENAELVAITVDMRGNVTFINDYLTSITGWTRQELLGRPFDAFIVPEQRDNVRRIFAESIATGRVLPHYEVDVVTSWGDTITISFTNVILRDLEGKAIGTAHIGEDVTARLRAAAEVRESRQEIIEILESITDGFFALDNDWRYTYVNKRAAELVEKKKEDLLFKTMWEALPETVGSKFDEEYHRAKREMTPVSFEAFYAPVNRWFEVHVYPYERGLSAYFSDITEEITAQKEFRRTADWLQLIIDSTDEGIYTIDCNGICTMYNRAASEMTGFAPEEAIGKNAHELIHHARPDGSPYPVEECPVIRACRVSRGVRIDSEVFWRKDGTSFPVEYSSYPIREEGEVHGAVITFTDITKRREIERELSLEKELSDGLNRLSVRINSSLDIDTIMSSVVVEAAHIVGADAAVIALREGNDWVVRYLYGVAERHMGTKLPATELQYIEMVLSAKTAVAISDVYTDDRIDNEFAKRFGVRSVLAVPLVVRGDIIGILRFVYTAAPATLTHAHVDFANQLALAVSLAIENARLYAVERNISETLQEALLTVPQQIAGISYGHLYRSATEATTVGGDFYDIFEVSGQKIGFVVGDVSGKGPRAATLTSLVKNVVRAYAMEDISPATVVQKTNEVVSRSVSASMFVTLFFGIIDTQDGRILYCNAGHPPGILKRASGETIILSTGSPIIGAFLGLNYIDDAQEFEKGDILILYTDGITEARCAGEFFGEERLMRFIQDTTVRSPKEVPDMLFAKVMECTAGILSDDIALLTIGLADNDEG